MISLVLAEIKETGKAEKKVLKVADPVKLEKLAKEGENAMSKAKAKADKEKVKRSAGEKTKMFRRKAG